MNPVPFEKSVDINVTIEGFESRFHSLQKETCCQPIKNNVNPLAAINSLTLLPLKSMTNTFKSYYLSFRTKNHCFSFLACMTMSISSKSMAVIS